MSDNEIPLEPVEDTVREHLTTAENWLVLAEEAATARTELHAERDRIHAAPEDGDDVDALEAKFHRLSSHYGDQLEQSAILADLHRKMAETYWTTIPQRIALSAPAEVDIARLREELGAKMAEDAKAFDATPTPEPPCECCAGGLLNAGSLDDPCQDCGHPGRAHYVPEEDPRDGINGPGETALLQAADRAAGAGWRQVADWLTACADCNREGKYWPPLIAAPASVTMAQRPPAWKSSGGAGQWNG